MAIILIKISIFTNMLYIEELQRKTGNPAQNLKSLFRFFAQGHEKWPGNNKLSSLLHLKTDYLGKNDYTPLIMLPKQRCLANQSKLF